MEIEKLKNLISKLDINGEYTSVLNNINTFYTKQEEQITKDYKEKLEAIYTNLLYVPNRVYMNENVYFIVHKSGTIVAIDKNLSNYAITTISKVNLDYFTVIHNVQLFDLLYCFSTSIYFQTTYKRINYCNFDNIV